MFFTDWLFYFLVIINASLTVAAIVILPGSPIPKSNDVSSTENANDNNQRRALPSGRKGLVIDRASCSASGILDLEAAVQSAKTLVSAGHSALSSTSDDHGALFSHFFHDHERPAVNTMLRNLYDRLNGIGPSVNFRCANTTEEFDKCARRGWTAFAQYYRREANIDNGNIITCPPFFSMPSLPNPCLRVFLLELDGPEGMNRAATLLHEMIHMPYMGGGGVWHVPDNHITTSIECATLKAYSDIIPEVTPATNVESYTHFMQWAWMKTAQKTRCPSMYPLWNALEPGTDDPPPQDELRKLLQADSDHTDDDVVICPNATFVDECSALSSMGNGTAGSATLDQGDQTDEDIIFIPP